MDDCGDVPTSRVITWKACEVRKCFVWPSFLPKQVSKQFFSREREVCASGRNLGMGRIVVSTGNSIIRLIRHICEKALEGLISRFEVDNRWDERGQSERWESAREQDKNKTCCLLG